MEFLLLFSNFLIMGNEANSSMALDNTLIAEIKHKNVIEELSSDKFQE